MEMVQQLFTSWYKIFAKECFKKDLSRVNERNISSKRVNKRPRVVFDFYFLTRHHETALAATFFSQKLLNCPCDSLTQIPELEAEPRRVTL